MISFNSAAYLQNLHAAAQPRFDYRGVENNDWESWRQAFRLALESALGLPLIRAGVENLPLSPRIKALTTANYSSAAAAIAIIIIKRVWDFVREHFAA